MNLLLVELKLLAFKDIPATKTTKDIRIDLPINMLVKKKKARS
jgi:hypothetical protein